MKNKIIIALVTVLVLSMIGSVVVYSIDVGTPAEPKASEPEKVEEEMAIVSPVDTHKVTKLSDGKFVFKDYDGKVIDLMYSSATSTVDGTPRKVYVDSNKRQYWVNNDNIVVGIDNLESSERRQYLEIPQDEVIGETEARRIAEFYAKCFYGDKFDDFEFVSLEVTERDYWFTYQRNFGVDGCISGSECGVILQPDGVLLTSGITDYEHTVDLDPAILAGFTQDKLLDIAEANVRAVFMDKLVDWELKKTQVVKNGDGYSLMFLIASDYINEDGIQLTSVDRYYYGVS